MNNADESYKKGCNEDASRLWMVAAQVAKEEGNVECQHETLVWSAVCQTMLGHIRQAMAGLLEARLLEESRPDAKFDDLACWILRKKQVECTLMHPDSLAGSMQSLDAVAQYACLHSVPKHDLDVLNGDVATCRGLWLDALEYYEIAQVKYVQDEPGYILHGFAHSASLAALRLGRFSAARDWIRLVSSTTFDRKYVRFTADLAKFALARAECDLSSLYAQLNAINAAPSNIDNFYIERQIARFWCAVLDRNEGDPDTRDHPARRLLSQMPITSDDLPKCFDYTLAVLDYRLACLRFSVDLPQNDDQWQAADPVEALSVDNTNDVTRRLKRAKIVAQGVMKRAEYLDRAFECDWRTQDVLKRTKVIEDIASALRPMNRVRARP